MNKKILATLVVSFGAVLVLGFQNCAKVVYGDDDAVTDPNTGSSTLPPAIVCGGISCELTPITKKPAVITALLAIGDHANDQLVIGGASAQFAAETLVRYSTPVVNPKILAILDSNNHSEDMEDGDYITKNLLKRYPNVNVKTEPSGGITDADLEGYDLVWFNNPGHPMGSVNSRDALLRFKGGVVVQGDDLSQGNGFSLEALTGLKYKDNGAHFSCNGQSYAADNNGGHMYDVFLNAARLGGGPADLDMLKFQYGNDIDDTDIVKPDLEILAWARGGVTGCTILRPAVVRYER